MAQTPSHATQTSTSFFTAPKVPQRRFLWLVLVTKSEDFIADPDDADSLIPRFTKTDNWGAFLSIDSANALAKDWFIREHGDMDDEQKDFFGRPTKNMWPGFWVPKGATEAKKNTKANGTVELHLVIGEGLEKTVYDVRIEEEEVYWEMDQPR